ncbi:MAG: rhomboid family intramembrane serine protease [Flavobacteriales bacterium]|nr:rhomboid family intramembrane serine protease [Flavobacteriales bacterium]
MEPSITIHLIIAITLVSVVAFGDQRLFSALLFEPFVMKARGEWYRVVTHAFVHANWPHLVVNMFVLYMFGRNVELLYGMVSERPVWSTYLLLFLGGVVFSSLPGFKRHALDPSYRAVGASGGVSSVLFAQVLMLPTTEVRFLLLPIPLQAWLFGVLYLVYSWQMDKRGGDNVAHDAHFYGAVFGVLFTVVLDPRLITHIGYLQRSIGY